MPAISFTVTLLWLKWQVFRY